MEDAASSSAGETPPGEQPWPPRSRRDSGASSSGGSIRSRAIGVSEAASEQDHSDPEQLSPLERDKLDHPEWYHSEPRTLRGVVTLAYPAKSLQCYMRRLNGNFTGQFVAMLACGYLGIKGSLYTFLTVGLLPFFKSHLHVTGGRFQDYTTIALSPWGMKAVFGTISDLFPIRGYHKRYYIALAGTVSAVCFLVLAAAKLEGAAGFAAMLCFGATSGVVVVDLLLEGQYAEMMVKKPQTGTDIVSWVWATYMAGTIVAAIVVGPLADAGNIQAMFWICVPLAVQIVVPALRGWLPEERSRAVSCFNRAKFQAHKPVFILALLMALGAMGLLVVTLTGTAAAKLIYAVLSAVALSVLAFALLPRQLAKSNLYLFLVEVLYVQVSGVSDYWYTADESCVPGGPAFSYSFYTTWSAIVQAMFAIVGIAMFQTIFKTWRLRHIFWVRAQVALGFLIHSPRQTQY